MAKYSYIVNNLSGGELSPRQQGRTDAGAVYVNGCLRLDNFATRSTSGVVKRTGTTLLDPDVTGNRYFPFEASDGRTFIFSPTFILLPKF